MAKKSRRTTAHNSIQTYMQRYNIPFTIEPAFIDCKEMSLNYKDGLIPLVDIAAGVDAVIGPWQGRVNQYFGMINLIPYFDKVDVNHVYSHSSFNRDPSPNHCLKIELDWFDQFAQASLGLKMPEKYGKIVLNADSTHTSTNRIRMGLKELPFWIADVPDQGDFASTFSLALLMAGHLFLAINVRNKRGVDIFDQHFIKVATGIYPAPQIDAIVNQVSGVAIKRAGNRIAGAIHNLNETYTTFDLDKDTNNPGRLLDMSLNWLMRNFKYQSIDGCMLSSFAMFIQDCEKVGITVSSIDADMLAKELNDRYTTTNAAQLSIKGACLLLNKARPGYTPLDPNYVVSNGLKHIARSIGIACAKDQLFQWQVGF
jgi:hypothetical protein